jgi:polyhydroxyalkanoate synthesis regulator phasin
MSWWHSVTHAVSSATDTVTKTATDVGNTVAKTTTDAANTVAKETTKAANTVADATVDAANATANFAESLVNDTSKAVKHTEQVCEKNAQTYASQGWDVTTNEWNTCQNAVTHAVTEGVEYVEYAAEEAYKWADANACYLGLNMALTTGCVLYFTPKPDPADPGTVNSTAISATYCGYIATMGSVNAMAIAVGTIITDSIWLIPGVKGSVDKKMLQNVITNVLATCNPVVLSASLATPALVGVFIGATISPIVSQLICERIAPKGTTQALTASSS